MDGFGISVTATNGVNGTRAINGIDGTKEIDLDHVQSDIQENKKYLSRAEEVGEVRIRSTL